MNTFLKVFLTQRLQFCVYFILDVQEADKDFYYHVVDQVAKHLEEKIKNHLYLNIGDENKKAWNLLEEFVEIREKQRPTFITNNYTISNKSQAYSSKDYQNGYVLYIKGILKFVRNVYAHTSRKNMNDITKNEALSLLIILSKAYNFIDSLKRII
ncbi:TIGR02391 family protein [Spiroplasma endosymbiont of Aleiodes alternator]|uniref:TIGR02391 family protein n=1 Tax=Spiroplasma endosymbiont of Aleiodes alternator TaxID=3139329 RepID=UPI003CCB2479